MRYMKTIAAIALASFLGQSPIHAQKTAQQSKQTVYQRDVEFEKLYADLESFENGRRGKSVNQNLESAAGSNFRARIQKLAKRYGFDLGETVKICTCGNYIQAEFDSFKHFTLGEFSTVMYNGRVKDVTAYGSHLKKITAFPGQEPVMKDLEIPEGYNMQRISETDFLTLREAVSLYNLQTNESRDDDRDWFESERYNCAYNQLRFINIELAESIGIEVRELGSDNLEVRAPKGTDRIVVSGFGEYVGKDILFTLSIRPDGKTDLWMKELDVNETETRTEKEIKFPKPKN